MKKIILITLFLLIGGIFLGSYVYSEETPTTEALEPEISQSAISKPKKLRFSCSDQVVRAFGIEIIDAFSKRTGIEVELFACSSSAAFYRLIHGLSDIASITHRLNFQNKEYGYVEIPFCRDPMAIIANSSCSLDDINEKQLNDIFSKTVTNWKELGGCDEPIMLIIPGKNTEAFKNFASMAMKANEIRYDLITYKSTMAIEAVKTFKGSISFIARGAVIKEQGVKTLKVNGMLPTDENYPYHQIFSFVTKGEPTGDSLELINASFSERGIKIMKERGMIPIPRQ
ncbi:MAG: substrate-binding domain-containing protein [Desulfobacterales bacterium]|nr:substrate-binding domain-containing protein [Desulfobacterales bacterium]